MPGFILYPAYKALSIARAGEKVTLKPLIDIVEAIKAETAVTKNIVDVFADCPSVRAPAIRAKLVGMSQKLKLANGVKLFAELLKAMGKTSANGTAGGLAAGGHLSLKIEHDFASSLGSFLGGFADIALAIAKSIDARLDHCELVVNQETIMRQLESPRGTSREQCRPTPKFTQFDF